MKLELRWHQINLRYDGKRWHVDAPAQEWEFMLDRATQQEKFTTDHPLDIALRVAHRFLGGPIQILCCAR